MHVVLVSRCLIFVGLICIQSHTFAQDEVSKHIEAHGPQILSEFRSLLEIPNVYDDQPNVRRNAEFLLGALKRRGVTAKLMELEGINPIVFGELNVPGATGTIMLYAHYDGMPVNASRWRNPPFAPTLFAAPTDSQPLEWPSDGTQIKDSWRIYARSAADDKTPIQAILTALDILAGSGSAPKSNIKVFFDGEEEDGSPHIRQFLKENARSLEADVWCFCDSPVHASGKPILVFGCRGLLTFDITVYGANRELHSGHFGNWAPNPAIGLSALLASMVSEDGTVLVNGFDEGTLELTPEEQAEIDRLPVQDEELRTSYGLPRANGRLADAPYRSSFNVRGIESGQASGPVRTIIPSSATAAIDIRLAPGTNPDRTWRAVHEHIRREGFHVLASNPTPEEIARHKKICILGRPTNSIMPFKSPLNGPHMKKVIEAVESAARERPFLIPAMGATLPVSPISELMDKPVVIVPTVNADNNQHTHDENIRVGNLWYSTRVMLELMKLEINAPTSMKH